MGLKGLKNQTKVVGVLSEKNLMVHGCKIKDENGKEAFTGQAIMGSIVLSTNSGDVECRVYVQSKNRKGEDVDLFEGWKTIMTTNVSKKEALMGKISYKLSDEIKAKGKTVTYKDVKIPIAEGTSATTLECIGSIDINDYLAKSGKVATSTQFNARVASDVGENVDKVAVFKIDGFINKITPEIINDEETGRQIIEFVNVDYLENAVPLSMYIDEDTYSYFEDVYEVGDTCELNGVISIFHVGAVKSTTGWGEKQNIYSGYDKTELLITGGENPYEEEFVDKKGNHLKVTNEERQQVLKKRELNLKTLLNNAPKTNSTPFGNNVSPDIELVDMDAVPF